jgi:hypothetical protein
MASAEQLASQVGVGDEEADAALRGARSASRYRAQSAPLRGDWQGRTELAGQIVVVVDMAPLPAARFA